LRAYQAVAPGERACGHKRERRHDCRQRDVAKRLVRSLNRVRVTPNHRETSRRPQPNVSRSKSAAIIAGSRRLVGKCGSINRHWHADSRGTLAVARSPSFETRAEARSSG
jgi:hypothetical protein